MEGWGEDRGYMGVTTGDGWQRGQGKNGLERGHGMDEWERGQGVDGWEQRQEMYG